MSALLRPSSTRAILLMQGPCSAVPSLLSRWHLPRCAARALLTNALLLRQRLLVLPGCQAFNRS